MDFPQKSQKSLNFGIVPYLQLNDNIYTIKNEKERK
jgi:hypothetical protein